MDTEIGNRPEILIDLAAKTRYMMKNEIMFVGKLKIYNNPTYIQFLESKVPTIRPTQDYIQLLDLNISKFLPELKGSFDIASFQLDNSLTLKRKIQNVSTVTVHFDKKGINVLLFEVLSYKNDHTSVFRYFARTKFGNDEKFRWVEYMLNDNEMLHNEDIDELIVHCEKFEFLNNIKIQNSYLSIVGVYSLKHLPCNNDKYYTGPEDFLFDNSKIEGPPKNFKGMYGIPFLSTKEKREMIKDLERQVKEEEQEKDNRSFFETETGMGTAIVSGSVGGVAIGGSLIYLVSHFK